MTCIVGLLAQLSPTIEAHLKPNLKGISGFLIRSYLPQVWVFDTGTENASLVVDNNGNVHASSGGVQPTDVLITTTHDSLSSALEAANGLRSRDSVGNRFYQPPVLYVEGKGRFQFAPK